MMNRGTPILGNHHIHVKGLSGKSMKIRGRFHCHVTKGSKKQRFNRRFDIKEPRSWTGTHEGPREGAIFSQPSIMKGGHHWMQQQNEPNINTLMVLPLYPTWWIFEINMLEDWYMFRYMFQWYQWWMWFKVLPWYLIFAQCARIVGQDQLEGDEPQKHLQHGHCYLVSEVSGLPRKWVAAGSSSPKQILD